MAHGLQLTRRARHLAEQRAVPGSVIGLILNYGESCDAGEGARKFALSKASLRALRRDLGGRATGNLAHFRKAYIVAAQDRIVTVAFSRRPLFH